MGYPVGGAPIDHAHPGTDPGPGTPQWPAGGPGQQAGIPGQQSAGYPSGEYPAAGYPSAGYPPQPPFSGDDEGNGGRWPCNELERVLAAANGDPSATPRVVEVLRRSRIWIPLPGGGDPSDPTLDLPSFQLADAVYVPVFSSEAQLRQGSADPAMPFVVAPMWEFARGLPLGVGIAVNPGGVIGIPMPAEAVRELCRGPRGSEPDAPGGDPYAADPYAADPYASSGYAGEHGSPEPGAHQDASQIGSRVALREPAPHEDPVEFLSAAVGELAATPVVLSARRALASVEGEPEKLFVGVELDSWQPADRDAATDALGRALGAVPLPWPVNIVLLDVAQDPVGDWMLSRVQPFFTRA